MADLTSLSTEEVIAACQQGAAEASSVLGRALDGALTLTVGAALAGSPPELPGELSAAGLAVVLILGGKGAVLALPESTGLVPEWCASPDATGESRLATLGQELGMLLLPESCMPDDFKVARVRNLTGAIARGMPSEAAAGVTLELRRDDGATGMAVLYWPLSNPAAVLGNQKAKEAEKPAEPPAARPDPVASSALAAAAVKAQAMEAAKRTTRRAATARDLPNYSQSLLRIRMPVLVTLARKKQALGRVVELGPGSIIHFDKSCEEMLELEVGGRVVARGEAVKVGDKFGLRINSIVLPDERFKSLRPTG